MQVKFGLAGLALASGVAGYLLGGGGIMDANSKEPRFPQLAIEQLTPAQRPLGDQILKISSVGLGGPYNPLLRSPVLGQNMFDLLKYLRWNSSLSPRLSEFTILMIARQWKSQVEWFAHAPLAAKAGVAASAIADLKAGKRPGDMQPDEAAVYDFVSELTAQHAVADETYARSKKSLSDQQIVDVTALAGTYTTVAMMLAMAEETVPAGKELPFKAAE